MATDISYCFPFHHYTKNLTCILSAPDKVADGNSLNDSADGRTTNCTCDFVDLSLDLVPQHARSRISPTFTLVNDHVKMIAFEYWL